MTKTWVPFYSVDAFARKPFTGNPAGVCIMSCSLDDQLYQSIASEMEHPETAFVEKIRENEYQLRWFTPKVEIRLCGHATLASAHVLFNHLSIESSQVSFHSLSGVLKASKTEEGVQLDFPRDDPYKVNPPEDILTGLGLKDVVEAIYGPQNMYLIFVLKDEKEVRGVKPDFSRLGTAKSSFNVKAVCITARGSHGYDFVSRMFAPWMGINEDPVTGSVHTVLTPYWSEKLGKNHLKAYQASDRGGELILGIDKQRAYITGSSVTVVKGKLFLEY